MSVPQRKLARIRDTMITQAIKRWLHKMFAWWPWRKAPETEYSYVGNSLNQGIAQEAVSRPTVDGVPPPSSVAPLVFGQGETSCSTIEEWPERAVQPPSTSGEKIEPPLPTLPTTPPLETAKEHTASPVKASLPDVPSTPTPEQQLEFLHYLIKRGIVNEGFAEGQVPKQYRRKK